MSTSHRTPPAILISLAEMAWLAAFGLLFAYKAKVGELGMVREEMEHVAGMVEKLGARSVSEVDSLLKEGERAAAELLELKRKQAQLEERLAESADAGNRMREQIRALQRERDEVAAKLEQVPPNARELANQLKELQSREAELRALVEEMEGDKHSLEVTLRNREEGEFSVRRELTGLPDGDLKKVVFVMDTSSSMRFSPAWDQARSLMRTWIQFLPVEECALVNFNDQATGFPKSGYHRVRTADGAELATEREKLLEEFDRANFGTFSDLLRGIRLAYSYADPDVIVIFSDGHPHVSYRADRALADAIFEVVAEHPDIPILPVALGSYEIEGAGGPRPRVNAPVSFMKELAKRTGGSFLGR